MSEPITAEPAETTPSSTMAAYYLAILFAGINRGLFIVCVAWTTLKISNSVATVGLVFVVLHLVTMLLGPPLGTLIDRFDRRLLIFLGEGLSAISFSVPFTVRLMGFDLAVGHLMLMAFVTSLAALTMTGAADAILQRLRPSGQRKKAVAYAGSTRQAAMVLGAGLGGYAIHLLSSEAAFLCGTIISGLVIALVRLLPSAPVPRQGTAIKRGFWADTLTGMQIIRKTPCLAILAVVTALAFSVGQLTNALLPGFIMFDMGAGSDLYGLADAAWSVGGVAAAFAVAQFAVLRTGTVQSPTLMAALLGLATIIFSLTDQAFEVILCHAAMGALFSIGKVLADGQVLELCPPEFVGRVRSNQQSLISAAGILMYVSPTLLEISSSKTLYQVWGIVVAVVACIVMAVAARFPCTDGSMEHVSK